LQLLLAAVNFGSDRRQERGRGQKEGIIVGGIMVVS